MERFGKCHLSIFFFVWKGRYKKTVTEIVV